MLFTAAVRAAGTGGTDTAAMMARARKAPELAVFDEAPDSPRGIGTHGLIGRAGPGFSPSAAFLQIRTRIITPHLAFAPGTRLGVYDITAQIGEGGMGQVYRATDTKLKRQVAIKILPPLLAADHDRLARFQREAEVLASLNHPNIAAIYGLEDGDGVKALVMELVEGEDLSQRTARGAIPLDDALLIAKQIVDALEAAHEQGIVHRDLKPANIKVRADGTVKVLDFGLAKATEASGSGLQATGALTQSPTITTPAMTQAGLILGTAAYMSPEQAAGTPVDRRADIWAFGVVLWEMLSGQRLFGGDTVVHTLADVLRRSIEFDKLDAPAPIKTLLRRCLDRDAKTRLRDIGEARVALARYLADPRAGPTCPGPEAFLSVDWLGRGGDSRHDRNDRVVAAAADGARRDGGGSGVYDRADDRKPHARRRPACNPPDLTRRLCGDLLQQHRVAW